MTRPYPAAGTVNGNGVLHMQVSRTGQDTTLSAPPPLMTDNTRGCLIDTEGVKRQKFMRSH